MGNINRASRKYEAREGILGSVYCFATATWEDFRMIRIFKQAKKTQHRLRVRTVHCETKRGIKILDINKSVN